MPYRTPPPSSAAPSDPSLPDEVPFNTRAPDRMINVGLLIALALFFLLFSDILTGPGQTPDRVAATRWMATGALVAAVIVAVRSRGERGTLRMKRDVLVRKTASSTQAISYRNLRDPDLHVRFPRRDFPGVTSAIYEQFIQRIWARTALFKWVLSPSPNQSKIADKLVAHAETLNGAAALPFGVLVTGDARTVVWGVEQACMNTPGPGQPIHHPTPTLFVTGYGLDTEDIVTSPRLALRHLHVVDLGLTREDPFFTAAMANAHHGGELSALAESFSPPDRLAALQHQEPRDREGAPSSPGYDRAAKLIELSSRGRIPGARDDDAQAQALASLFDAVPELLGFIGGWVTTTSALPFVAFGELAMLLRLRGTYGPIRYGADLAQRALWLIEELAGSEDRDVQTLLRAGFFEAYLCSLGEWSERDCLEPLLGPRSRAILAEVASYWRSSKST
jgi:hypothetical protein